MTESTDITSFPEPAWMKDYQGPSFEDSIHGTRVTMSGEQYQELLSLAGAMRKVVASDSYFALYSDSACIDGWVEKLTPDEVQAIRDLRPNAWDMPS